MPDRPDRRKSLLRKVVATVAAALLSLAAAAPSPATTTTAPSSPPVEAIAYHAIAASFLGNPRTVGYYADMLTSYDLALEAQGRLRTGCADDIAWLWAESLATPRAREAGYRRVLERPADALVATSIETALRESLPEKIRITRRQDRWDRWADLFNAAGHNLGRMANGQIGAGVKFLLEFVFARRQFTKVTERERKEWYLIDTYLRLNPEGPEAERLRRRLEKIESDLRKDAVRKCIQMAEHYAARGWWDEAYYYVKAAEDAGYRGKRKFRRRVRQAVADRKRWAERSLAVADTERFLQTAEQVRAYNALLESLALGDPKRLKRDAARAGRILAGTPLADEVEDVWSLLFEWAGDRRQALEIQRDLALRHPDTQTGRAASARLEDPYYNPRARYDRELAKYRRKQLHYVFFGERTTEQQLELFSRLVTPSVPQLGAVGLLFVTDIMLRSVLVSFGNPISPENVLAAGEQLLANPRNLLTKDEAADIQVTLGVLYHKLRRYDKEMAAYREAHILSPELDRKLTEHAADEQLRRILETNDTNRQVLLLDRLIAKYPKTEAARRARDRLEQIRTASKVDFLIPHDWLVEDPIHWMRLGLAIPYELIDGSTGNGEINERGVVFWRDVPSSATYVALDGTKGHINLTPRRRAVLRAAAELWADQQTALEQGAAALASRKLPFEIRGSLGTEGLIVFPTISHIPLSEEEKRLFR